MRMRFIRAASVVISAVFVLTACGSSPAPVADNSWADLKIMVGGMSKQIYLPNKLTEILGYFKDQRLNVTLIDEQSGQSSEEEVIAGNVNGGSGSYSHVLELQPRGKFMTQVVQFQIAPGEAEMVDATKAGSIKSAADLRGKKLGVTSLGSGTHTITLALLGKAGLKATDASFVPVGAGNTFISAMQKHQIDAGMTTEPTISRLLKTGVGKVLIDLRTPETTRAALGADYPFIGIFMMSDYVSKNRGVVQRLVNAYVKTLKWMKNHSAAEIADKMPADYLANDRDMYVTALDAQKDSFTADGIMPLAGAQNALDIELQYVPDMLGKKVDLARTYTNDFAKAAK